MFQDSLTKKIAEAAAQIKTEPKENEINEKSVEGAVVKVMNEKLVGDQHKIDANKNNKVDAHDFKILRAQKEKEKANSQKFGKDVKEEAEQIDEISKTTLNNYLKGVKRENDPRIHGDSAGSGNQMSNKARSLGRTEQDKEDSRYEGQKLAKRKLGAPGTIPAKVMAKEETEQIDELLKQDTKNSFIASKMKDDDSTKSKAEFTNKTKGFTLDAAKSSLKNKIKSTHHDKYDIDNTSSFDHAVKKYHKAKMAGHLNEEVEELDELSKSTLASYAKKAAGSVNTASRIASRSASLSGQESKPMQDIVDKRTLGIKKAVNRLSKEEVEQIDEISLKTATNAYVKRMGPDSDEKDPYGHKAIKTMDHIANRYGVKGVTKAAKAADDKYGIHDPEHNPRKDYIKMIMRGAKPFKKEEVELDEAMFPGTKEYEKKYGQSPQQKLRKKGDTVPTSQGEMKKTEKGVMHTRRFSEMLETYREGGLKTISEMLVKEEPSQEEFEKEIDQQKKRNNGEIRNDKGVAKPFQSASVREEPVNPVEEEVQEIEERSLTEPEMKKKEEIVKSMKKGMAGFKERYGKRAKEVMYATATARAKGE